MKQPAPDPRQAAALLRKATKSAPMQGEDLLGGDDLKRRLADAKAKEAKRKGRK